MNCQDISSIADTGRFGNLAEPQRRAAEAHALTCRHCAPVWAAHARLSGLLIPAMPEGLSARCRALAAVPVQARIGIAARRLTVVGCVALAAAAAILIIHFGEKQVRQSRLAEAMVPAATYPAPAQVSMPREVAVPVVVNEAASSRPAQVAAAQSDESLPLLLPPDDSEPERAVDLALQKLADAHPELVGSELAGFFTVAMLTRADGTLIISGVRMIPPGPSAEEHSAA